MHEAQPLPTVQDAGRRAKAAEVVEDVVLQVVQPGLGLPHGRRLDAEGQVFRFCQAVVSLASWVFSIWLYSARMSSKPSF